MNVKLTRSELALLSSVISDYLNEKNDLKYITNEGRNKLIEMEIDFGKMAFPQMEKYLTPEIIKKKKANYSSIIANLKS